ncbi:MAG: twin-arginine translocase TatA/TatE family subunit [Firmicutes bacterium]|nr:twin-arginine translocase TatA/TatE family subunit [Bacillota bacterium]
MFSGAFQPLHLLLILIVVLIIFGPGKLPDVGKALGKTISEFKRSTQADIDEPEETKAKDQATKA